MMTSTTVAGVSVNSSRGPLPSLVDFILCDEDDDGARFSGSSLFSLKVILTRESNPDTVFSATVNYGKIDSDF